MEHIDVALESLSVFTMQDLLYKAYGASEGSKQPRSTVFTEQVYGDFASI